MEPTIKKVSYSIVVFAMPMCGRIHNYQHFYNDYDSAMDFIATSHYYARTIGDYIYYEIGLYKLTEFDTNPVAILTDVKYFKQYRNGKLFKSVSDNQVVYYDAWYMDFSKTQIED